MYSVKMAITRITTRGINKDNKAITHPAHPISDSFQVMDSFLESPQTKIVSVKVHPLTHGSRSQPQHKRHKQQWVDQKSQEEPYPLVWEECLAEHDRNHQAQKRYQQIDWLMRC
jgi:hypothetical protein